MHFHNHDEFLLRSNHNGSSTKATCYSDSDISWVLISSVLVLGMMPGLAFFEAGLLRAKNTTSVIIQIFSGAAVLPALWVLFGYSLALGTNTGSGFIGDFSKVIFFGVSFTSCYEAAPKIPEALYALFQMMFATITPLLLTGAYAERLAFRPYLIFTVLWEILVYYPVAHWMWSPNGWLKNLGAEDFAGGIVIHLTAGISAIVSALMLGQRHDFHKHHGEAPYSSLPLTSIGATMLWTGWFGFNGGSALQAGTSAVQAVTNSQVAAAVCSTCFLLYHMLRNGKASLIHCINGAIAGLAGVTPASGFIDIQAAFCLGIILSITTQVALFLLKHKLKIDDALDVSSVHGVPGVVGALFIGWCGNADVSGANGVVNGGGFRLFGVQVLAIVVVGAWSALWTFVLFRVIALRYPLRVDERQERVGLDHSLHNEPSVVHETTRDSVGSASTQRPTRASIGVGGSTRRSAVVVLGDGAINQNSFAVRLMDDGMHIRNLTNVDTIDVDGDPRLSGDDVPGSPTETAIVPLIGHDRLAGGGGIQRGYTE